MILFKYAHVILGDLGFVYDVISLVETGLSKTILTLLNNKSSSSKVLGFLYFDIAHVFT